MENYVLVVEEVKARVHNTNAKAGRSAEWLHIATKGIGLGAELLPRPSDCIVARDDFRNGFFVRKKLVLDRLRDIQHTLPIETICRIAL